MRPKSTETVGEHLLVEALRAGDPCLVAAHGGYPEFLVSGDDPDLAIRGTFLAALLRGDVSDVPRSGRLQLAGARVEGPVALQGCRLDFSLEFLDCLFAGDLELGGSELRALAFARCKLTQLLGEQLAAPGGVELHSTMVGSITLSQAKLPGGLTLNEVKFSAVPEAFFADDLDVGRDVVFRRIASSGELRFLAAKIHGQLRIVESDIRHASGGSISAGKCDVDQDVIVSASSLEGSVELDEATINGALRVHDAQLKTPNGLALTADRATIGSVVFVSTRVMGAVQFMGAESRGEFRLTNCQCEDWGGKGLALSSIKIGGPLRFAAVSVTGAISLDNANVEGALLFRQVDVSLEGGPALVLASATLHLVRLSRIRCVGSFLFTGARSDNYIVVSEATFTGAGDVAVVGQSAVVRGLSSEGEVTVDGEVSFAGIDASEQLALGEWRIGGGRDRSAFDLRFAKIGILVLPSMTSNGMVDLEGTTVRTLSDGWPHIRYAHEIRDFKYQRLGTGTVSERLDWLRSSGDGYHPQPYEEFAASLSRDGRDADARHVRYMKHREGRSQLGVMQRAGNRLFGWSTGYGYKPWRGLVVLAALWISGWVVFGLAHASNEITPIATVSGAAKHPVPPPPFHAWLYSLDSLLPLVSLGLRDHWESRGFALGWFAFCVIAGWALVTVVLGSVTARFVRD